MLIDDLKAEAVKASDNDKILALVGVIQILCRTASYEDCKEALELLKQVNKEISNG